MGWGGAALESLHPPLHVVVAGDTEAQAGDNLPTRRDRAMVCPPCRVPWGLARGQVGAQSGVRSLGGAFWEGWEQRWEPMGRGLPEGPLTSALLSRLNPHRPPWAFSTQAGS